MLYFQLLRICLPPTRLLTHLVYLPCMCFFNSNSLLLIKLCASKFISEVSYFMPKLSFAHCFASSILVAGTQTRGASAIGIPIIPSVITCAPVGIVTGTPRPSAGFPAYTRSMISGSGSRSRAGLLPPVELLAVLCHVRLKPLSGTSATCSDLLPVLPCLHLLVCHEYRYVKACRPGATRGMVNAWDTPRPSGGRKEMVSNGHP